MNSSAGSVHPVKRVASARTFFYAALVTFEGKREQAGANSLFLREEKRTMPAG